jgi:hypothetical protein
MGAAKSLNDYFGETPMRLLLVICCLVACSLVNAADEKKKKDGVEVVGYMMSKPGSAAADVVCLMNVRNKSKVQSLNLKAATPDIAKKLTTFLEKKTPFVKVVGKPQDTFFLVESAEETATDPNAGKKK